MNRGPFHGLRPVLGKAMQRLQLAYVTADPQDKRQIEMAADLLRIKIGGNNTPLLDPPANSEADGEVWLGKVIHGEQRLGWVGLDRKQLTTHLGIFGTTGAGKTTACISMLLRLIELGSPWVAIDPKRSIRCLHAMPSQRPVRVLTAGRDIGATLRFNPLELPPGADVSSHIAELVQLMSDTWHGGVGIASVLEDAMKTAYTRTKSPTLTDVRRVLDQNTFSGRSSQWVQSAHRIMKTLTDGRLGKVCCIADKYSDDLDALMSGHTVIETDGLTREEASFLVSSLLLQIHQRLQATSSPEHLKLTMLIDEAEQLLVKRDAQRESLLERMIRMSRESGLSIWVASQQASRMSPTILANISTLIAMRAHHRDDVSILSRMLMLPEHAVPMLGTLGTGQAVCRIPHWKSPIMVQIPNLSPLPQGRVSDSLLAQSSCSSTGHERLLDAIEFAAMSDSADSAESNAIRGQEPQQAADNPVPLTESAWVPQVEHAGSHDDEPPDSSKENPTPDPLRQSSELRRLLKHIAQFPFKPVTKRYIELDLSRRKGNALRQQLEHEQLVTPIPISTPKGILTLLETSSPAKSWLKRARAIITPTNGGLLHAYWQHECRLRLEELGWRVKLEWNPSKADHFIDLAAWKDEQSLLIEIETGKSHWKKNINTLISTKTDFRFVLWVGESKDIPEDTPPSITHCVPRTLSTKLKALDPLATNELEVM